MTSMVSKKHPVRNLTDQLKKHNAFTAENIPRIAAFYTKLLVQEPLRLIEKASSHQRIKEHQLERDPIFIVGHWRSGTSFLQYMLGQDPQFGYLNKFQAVFPDLFLKSEGMLKSLVNCIPDTLNLIRDAQNMSINLDLESPSEIEIALTTMISPTSLHWGHIFPQESEQYFDKFLDLENASSQELARWRRDYTHLIKKVSMKSGARQILIKSPGNASRISQLLELYPNAKFVFIHRNPYDVFYSSQKLWNTLLDNLALQSFSQQQMEQEIIRIYRKVMKSYLRQRKTVPDGQLTEVRFNDFVSNPIQELSGIYNDLSIPNFDFAHDRFNSFLSQKTEGKSTSYDYHDEHIDELNKKWRFAFEEWNYRMLNQPQKKAKVI